MLKPEAVSLVDSIAPPDFILNSALGMSDGKVLDKLELIPYAILTYIYLKEKQ